MLKPELMSLRQSRTITYLSLLEEARAVSWLNSRNSTSLEARLVLCHPGWLPTGRTTLIGLGLSEFRLSEVRGTCRADIIWGYKCPLPEQTIEADHMFPRALGGPATGTNQVWLCRLHNQWKSCDLLAFPWEFGEPEWLSEQIARVQEVVTEGARLDF